MMCLELVNRYGVSVPGASYAIETSTGVIEIEPRIFGWPEGYAIRCTVTPPVTPRVPPAEGTPE